MKKKKIRRSIISSLFNNEQPKVTDSIDDESDNNELDDITDKNEEQKNDELKR